MPRKFLVTAALVLLLVACGKQQESSPALEPADSVFIGSHILTMDPNMPSAEAVAVRGEHIVFVGDRSGVKAFTGDKTRVVNLGDHALLPGFIDAHGHFTFTARTIDFANLSSPPVGKAESVDDIVTLLKAHIAETQPGAGEWVTGYGYDDSLLEEGRHPTRKDLDQVSTEHPIYLMHVSTHLAAVNSAALAAVGIDANSTNPPGGIIRRWPGTDEPNGVMEETAASTFLFARMGEIDAQRFTDKIARAIELYAGYGITTIQDGASSLSDVEALRAIASKGGVTADVAMFPYANSLQDEDFASFNYDGDYLNGVRVAGVKFVIDGSPQGRTAWMTRPYDELPEGAKQGYVAYAAADVEDYKKNVAQLVTRGVPVLVHANGDAAIDAMMDGIDDAIIGTAIADHRSVIIHAQLMRQDQLDRAATLKLVPSFFSAHSFFWGDWHRLSFGEERASGISPAASALAKGVPFTIHNDAPVVPPDMMRLVWATVNRTTRSGYVLGPEERLSVTQALHAITLGAAYQYFEEDTKGSLTVGKQADLVILGADPLEVAPATLADVPIVETFSRGKTIFKRKSSH